MKYILYFLTMNLKSLLLLRLEGGLHRNYLFAYNTVLLVFFMVLLHKDNISKVVSVSNTSVNQGVYMPTCQFMSRSDPICELYFYYKDAWTDSQTD